MSLKPSTGGSTAPDPARIYTLLARWRVPLGFIGVFATLLLARPTWRTLAIGGGVVLFGEAVRVWAAGHLEKGREVTRSGPYRWSAHPLYVGSAIIGAGLAIASARAAVAVLALVYLGTTLTAAIRTEEAELRAKFGDEYYSYRAGRLGLSKRRFSLERAWRNREYRSVAGVMVGLALLALKPLFGL